MGGDECVEHQAGVVTEVTSMVMKEPPNGRSRLPQYTPMPAQKSKGSISTIDEK